MRAPPLICRIPCRILTTQKGHKTTLEVRTLPLIRSTIMHDPSSYTKFSLPHLQAHSGPSFSACKIEKLGMGLGTRMHKTIQEAMTLPLIKTFLATPSLGWVSEWGSTVQSHAVNLASSSWLVTLAYWCVYTMQGGECGRVYALKGLVVFMLYNIMSVLVCTSNLAGGCFQQAS